MHISALTRSKKCSPIKSVKLRARTHFLLFFVFLSNLMDYLSAENV